MIKLKGESFTIDLFISLPNIVKAYCYVIKTKLGVFKLSVIERKAMSTMKSPGIKQSFLPKTLLADCTEVFVRREKRRRGRGVGRKGWLVKVSTARRWVKSVEG